MSRESKKEDSQAIKVTIRIRPKKPDETEGDWTVSDTPQGTKQLTAEAKTATPSRRGSKGGDRSFQFDSVYEPTVDNGTIFEHLLRPPCQKCLEGFNFTVFAYGQTGSGKTHTMLGVPEDPGLLWRTIEELIRQAKQSASRRTTFRVECFEIYNEEVRDLFARGGYESKVGLKVVDHPVKGSSVQGATEKMIHDEADVRKLLQQALSHRATSATNMNATSSRSHCIVRLSIESRQCTEGEVPGVTSLVQAFGEIQKARGMTTILSQFNFVDLAGSERLHKTGATGDTLKEGTMVNKSLLTLGTCIRELSTPNCKTHVPYRDSKLTRLLRNALGGNSYTVAVCNIADCIEHADETTSTLKFASFTSQVINKAVKNEHAATAALLQRYKSEVEELKRQLSEHVDDEAAAAQAKQESAKNVVSKMKAVLAVKSRNEARSEVEELKSQVARQKIANLWQRSSYASLNKKLQEENAMHVTYTQQCETVVKELTERLISEGKFMLGTPRGDGDQALSLSSSVHQKLDMQKELERKEVEVIEMQRKLKRVSISTMWRTITRTTLTDRMQARLDDAEAQLSQMMALNEALSEELQDLKKHAEPAQTFSTTDLATMRQEIESLRSGYMERGTDEVKEREALRLEKKMNEIERLQRDNLTSASLVNWQKWRAAEGKLRVAERDNDKLRQDLDTANRWIAHLEDEVREAATTKESNSDLVDLKLDLERATSAQHTSPTARKLAGLTLTEPPEEANKPTPQHFEREMSGARHRPSEHGGLSRISEVKRDSMMSEARSDSQAISLESHESDGPQQSDSAWKKLLCWAACFHGDVEAPQATDAKDDGDAGNIARVSLYESSHTKTAL